MSTNKKLVSITINMYLHEKENLKISQIFLLW